MLKRFTKGAPAAGLAMLNAIVDELNSLLGWLFNLRGDDQFVFLRRGPGGGIIYLNIDAVLRRVPKALAGQETISGLVTGNASGHGKYTGKSFADVTADVSASGDLAESDFGTLAASNDCLVLVPAELGNSTTGHDVTAAANTAKFAIYFTGRLVRINSDGTKVVHATMFWAGC